MTSDSPVIVFPHLGIEIQELPNKINLFGLDIAFYGILIAIAVFLAVILCMKRAKDTEQKSSDYIDLAIIGVIAAIIGARLYYVAFSLDHYLSDPLEIFNIRNGGLAIYGGIAGGFLAGYLTCRIKRISVLKVLDTAAPAIALGQAIGRWGNFFNKEAYGDYTDSLFAMRIRMTDASGVINRSVADNIVTVNGTDYIQVHPTFFYESAWCLILFILIIIFRKYQQYDGEVLLWYLGGYALERVIVEGLRTDSLKLWNTDIAVSQLLSAILLAAAFIILIIKRIKIIKERKIISGGNK